MIISTSSISRFNLKFLLRTVGGPPQMPSTACLTPCLTPCITRQLNITIFYPANPFSNFTLDREIKAILKIKRHQYYCVYMTFFSLCYMPIQPNDILITFSYRLLCYIYDVVIFLTDKQTFATEAKRGNDTQYNLGCADLYAFLVLIKYVFYFNLILVVAYQLYTKYRVRFKIRKSDGTKIVSTYLLQLICILLNTHV